MLTVNAASGFGSGGGGPARVAMGDAPQTNLIWHTRADTGVTVVTGVSAWTDQVGSVDMVQASTTLQPAYDANATVGTFVGAGKITSDGSNDFMAAPTGFSQPCHIFFVFQTLTWDRDDSIMIKIDAATRGHVSLAGYPATSPNLQLWADSAGPQDGPPTSTWALCSIVFNGASSSVAINDDTPVTGSNPGTGGFDGTGWHFFGSNISGQYIHADFAELLIYDAAMTGSDLTDIKDYINDQYELW